MNRRGAELLPPAKDTEERRAFLDALTKAEAMTPTEQARLIRDYGFARLLAGVDRLGLQKFLRFLTTIDNHRLAEAKLGRAGDAVKREAAKDQALGEIWKLCGNCEACSEQVDQVLRGLELQLLGVQPVEVRDVDESESS